MRNVNMTFTKPTESDVLQCPIEQQLTQREKSEYTCTYDRVQSTYRHLHLRTTTYIHLFLDVMYKQLRTH